MSELAGFEAETEGTSCGWKSRLAESVSDVDFRLSFPLAPLRGHQLKDLNHVDPKAIMANERTLLHYAEKALYVSTCSALLFKSGSLQGDESITD
eukprot:6468564-Amphidinium_carterae.2